MPPKHFRYDGPFCDFYDAIPTSAKRRDVAFYVDYARAAKGPVLELGCGTGRILIPSAAAGRHIVGLDLSPAMLAKCAEKLQQQPREIQKRARLVRGDMTRFHLGQKFSLVTIPFRCFQHLLTIKEQLACLRCANRHLRIGGRLVLDLLRTSPEVAEDRRWQKEVAVGGEVKLPDGTKLRVTSRVARCHAAEQCNDLDTIFYVTRPGRRTQRMVQTFPFRYVYRFEAEHLLARSGFRVAHLFGSFSRAALNKKSIHLIFVAEKTREIRGSQ